jgi:GNAT superfamily N-acetyltransferase
MRVAIAAFTSDDRADLYTGFAQVVDDLDGWPQQPPLSPGEFDEVWLAHTAGTFVARLDGRFAGAYYLKANFRGRAGHIANAGYFVPSDLRGHGIGEAMVRHSIASAPGLGFDALMFNLVFASNPARRLYERLGFEAIGRIPDAVAGEDAVIYWRRLP